MKPAVLSYILGVCSGILTLSLISYNQSDISFICDASNKAAVANWFGAFGAYLASSMLYIFGSSALLVPVILCATAIIVSNYALYKNWISRVCALGSMLPFLSALGNLEGFDLYGSVYPGELLVFMGIY